MALAPPSRAATTQHGSEVHAAKEDGPAVGLEAVTATNPVGPGQRGQGRMRNWRREDLRSVVRVDWGVVLGPRKTASPLKMLHIPRDFLAASHPQLWDGMAVELQVKVPGCAM